MSSSVLSVGLVFGSGIVTVLSPQILPALPIIIGRCSEPIAIVGGLIGGFAVTGSLRGVIAEFT